MNDKAQVVISDILIKSAEDVQQLAGLFRDTAERIITNKLIDLP